jgi:hypothetical protein
MWVDHKSDIVEEWAAMSRKATAVVLIAGLSVLLAVGLRKANRAEAAAADCYSEASGPSTPTICN